MNKMTLSAAVEARMAKAVLCLGLAVTTLGLSTQAQACNARGEFCGHPAWASNAFAGPRDRVPESTLAPTRHYQPQPTHSGKPARIQRVVKKTVPEKVVKKVAPLVKFADGLGRQFDPASKVWFDGTSQCWSGKEQFTVKNGDWFYGKKEWAEANGVWEVEFGDAPELVSCESVPSFAAKAKAIAATQAGKGATSQPAPVAPSPAKVKTAEGETAVTAQKPAAPAECKKYFPSIGQMLSIPCAE